MLEDEVNRTVVLVDRLLKELSEDIQRQTNFVAIERQHEHSIGFIKTGEIMGASLTNLSPVTPPLVLCNSIEGFGVNIAALGRHSLDRKDVAIWHQQLANAVSRTLERQARCHIYPCGGGATQVARPRSPLTEIRLAGMQENVLRSLQRMGLPIQRVAISERTGRATSTEVHLYLN